MLSIEIDHAPVHSVRTLLFLDQQLLEEGRLFLGRKNGSRKDLFFNRGRKRNLLDRRPLLVFLFFHSKPSLWIFFFFLLVLFPINRLFRLAGVLLQSALRSLGEGVVGALRLGLAAAAAGPGKVGMGMAFRRLVQAAPKGIDAVERRLLGASSLLDVVGGGGFLDNDNLIVAAGGASTFGPQKAHRRLCVCVLRVVGVLGVCCEGGSNLAKLTPDLPKIVFARKRKKACCLVAILIDHKSHVSGVFSFARSCLSLQRTQLLLLTWQNHSKNTTEHRDSKGIFES